MWNFFDKEYPEEGEYVTIIWSDGNESDCIWTNEGMTWDNPEYNIPICWKSPEIYQLGEDE